MSDKRPDPFLCAPGLRIEAQEKLANLHYERIDQRHTALEQLVHRLERRLWLAVSGLAGTIIAQAVQHLINQG